MGVQWSGGCGFLVLELQRQRTDWQTSLRLQNYRGTIDVVDSVCQYCRDSCLKLL